MDIEKVIREPIVPDSDILVELRNEFTTLKCAELLARVTRDICAALGVTIEYKVTHVDNEPKIKRTVIADNLSGLITIISAVLAGAKVNPISVLKDNYDVSKAQQIARDREAAFQQHRAKSTQGQRETEGPSDASNEASDGGGQSDSGREDTPA